MQLHKAEMEGKSKASCLPLHPHQDPVKVFGAKVSIIFGKKENSLQKGNFPGCYVDQEKLQAVYTPAILWLKSTGEFFSLLTCLNAS